MDKREAIVFTAAGLIHQYGYNKVGIKAILDELSIPKGSFYHYFKSKEDLGLAIIDVYLSDTQSCIQSVDQSMDGLVKFYSIFFNRLRELSYMRGCPVGNLILELSDENDRFRKRLYIWYDTLNTWTEEILKEAGIDYAEKKAMALTAAFEGAMMFTKLEKASEHLDVFMEVTFPAIIKMS